MHLNCGVGEDSWESLDCKEMKPVNPKGKQSWIFFRRTDAEAEASNTLITWCEELTPWKRPWFWEWFKAGGEWDDRGWDGWITSLTQWSWVWASSGNWWWTGKPGMLWSMGSRVWHDWAPELNLTESSIKIAHIPLRARQNSYNLAGKFWFIYCILQTLNLQISIYFSLYQVCIMGKKTLWVVFNLAGLK